jgi:hypothetical protein
MAARPRPNQTRSGMRNHQPGRKPIARAVSDRRPVASAVRGSSAIATDGGDDRNPERPPPIGIAAGKPARAGGAVGHTSAGATSQANQATPHCGGAIQVAEQPEHHAAQSAFRKRARAASRRTPSRPSRSSRRPAQRTTTPASRESVRPSKRHESKNSTPPQPTPRRRLRSRRPTRPASSAPPDRAEPEHQQRADKRRRKSRARTDRRVDCA